MGFFDLLLQMRGTQLVGSIRFKDQLFGSVIDWMWFSAGLFQLRIIFYFFE
jgi:hypothetical protein